MISRIFLILIFSMSAWIGVAQKNFEIKFEFDNYENDTLLLAYFYADRQLIQDTVLADQNGEFIYSGEDTLDGGVYILMFFPEKDYIQFLINEKETFFTIKGDRNDLSRPQFIGSPDNELFYGYLDFIKVLKAKADELNAIRQQAVFEKSDTSEIDDQRVQLDQSVKQYQNEIIHNNPESITSILIKGNREVEFPEFDADGEELEKLKFYYYRNHFLDGIDLGNPVVLRTPFINYKIERYLEKLTVQMQDSIIVSVDYLLQKMEPSLNTWKFYVAHILNKYANSKVIGMDGVYVHMVDTYYASGRTPWADAETLEKIIDNADKLRDVLLGKIAPDVTLYTEAGKEVRLHEIESPYTVLVFWAPDCGHCKKSMAAVVEFDEKFKSKGVSTVSICTKHMDKTASCWEFVKEKNMEGFAYNLADEYHRSRFQVKYNIRTTPQIFILDKDKKILIKRLASEKLEDVMLEILKMEASQETE